MNKKQLVVAWSMVILFLGGCNSPNYIIQLQGIIIEWNDAIQIASSTSRIALSQPVAKLQEIKREAEKIDIPQRRKDCYSHLLKYMDLRINLFLSFMQQKESLSKFYAGETYEELDKWELCLTEKERKLLEIPDKEDRLLRKKLKQELDEIKQEINRQQTKESELAEKKAKKGKDVFTIKLEGIFFDKENGNYAIMNGDIVREGSEIRNVVVQKIERNFIIIIIDGQERNLRIGEAVSSVIYNSLDNKK